MVPVLVGLLLLLLVTSVGVSVVSRYDLQMIPTTYLTAAYYYYIIHYLISKYLQVPSTTRTPFLPSSPSSFPEAAHLPLSPDAFLVACRPLKVVAAPVS